MSGKFEISKRKNDEFQFNLKAGNGEVLLTSEGYAAKASASIGIESVRMHARNQDNFQRLSAVDGREYFVLIAGNGQVIGQGQMYADAGGRDKGIASVQANAPEATVVDLAG